MASVYALTGHGADASVGGYAYSHTANFYDVTSGANGSCSGSYLCTGGVGYDGPTGVGTPNATAMAGGGGGTGGAGGGGGGGTGGAGGGGGGGTGGTGGSGGGGGTTNTCSHPICSSGAKLVSSCDTCVTAICAGDPYCCRTAWDNICVGEVKSVCGETCP